MRSMSNSILATLFVLVLLLVIPLLAVFGVPDFVPVVASSSADRHPDELDLARTPSVGQSHGYSPEDLFAPFDEARAEALPAETSAADPWATENPRVSPARFDAGRGRSREAFDTSRRRSSETPVRLSAAAHWNDRREPAPPVPDADLFAVAPPRSSPDPTEKPAGRAFPRDRDDEPPTEAGPGTLTWRDAVARLNELGVHDYRLTPGPDGRDFHFACFVAGAGGSRVTHRFEAEAHEPLRAVEKVLEQLTKWSQARR